MGEERGGLLANVIAQIAGVKANIETKNRIIVEFLNELSFCFVTEKRQTKTCNSSEKGSGGSGAMRVNSHPRSRNVFICKYVIMMELLQYSVEHTAGCVFYPEWNLEMNEKQGFEID